MTKNEAMCPGPSTFGLHHGCIQSSRLPTGSPILDFGSSSALSGRISSCNASDCSSMPSRLAQYTEIACDVARQRCMPPRVPSDRVTSCIKTFIDTTYRYIIYLIANSNPFK